MADWRVVVKGDKVAKSGNSKLFIPYIYPPLKMGKIGEVWVYDYYLYFLLSNTLILFNFNRFKNRA